MALQSRWTVEGVELIPQIEGERYEIIDGELYVTTQPHWRHQETCDNIIIELGTWSRNSRLGRTFQGPGVVYDKIDLAAIAWLCLCD